MKKFLSKVKEYVPIFSLCVFAFTVISLVIYLIVLNNVGFADFFNYNISAPFRALITWSTVIFPFSVVEIFLFVSPLVLIFLIFLAVRYGKRGLKTTVSQDSATKYCKCKKYKDDRIANVKNQLIIMKKSQREAQN